MATKSIHNSRYRELIKSLIEARKSQGKTQQEVANSLEKPQSYVAKYEKLERRLDVLELTEICKALGINVNDIIKKI